MNILLAAVILALTVLSASILYAVRAVVLNKSEAPTPLAYSPVPIARNEWRAEVEAQIKTLTLAVSDGIERTDRAEKRIRKTVTSARKLVRENGLDHPGLEAEFEELQPRDAEAEQPLPTLPAEVEGSRVIRFPGGELEIGAA